MRSKIKREHLKALSGAVICLEKTGLAGKYSRLAGNNFDKTINSSPKPIKNQLNQALNKSVVYLLRFILRPPSAALPNRPRRKLGLLLAGIGGGIGGTLGFAGIFVELPIITFLVLRTIAEIALYYGEDLNTLEGRLACLEVLALGARPAAKAKYDGYFSTRAKLATLVGNSVYLSFDSGIFSASNQMLNRALMDIAGRIGFALSERISVGALPVVGAAAGGIISLMFLRHYQNIATAHFTVRKLERIYGVEIIRRHYLDLHELHKN